MKIKMSFSLLFLFFFFCPRDSNNKNPKLSKYEKGLRYLESGNYSEAYSTFESLVKKEEKNLSICSERFLQAQQVSSQNFQNQ
jgi:outer membrane protein assembly factor BamD (BamD/ComL family)